MFVHLTTSLIIIIQCFIPFWIYNSEYAHSFQVSNADTDHDFDDTIAIETMFVSFM
jgi:hypothetical protein